MHSEFAVLRLRRTLRGAVLTAVLAATLAAARAGITSERLLAAVVERTPEPTLVADGMQLRSAKQAAAAIAGAQVFVGAGESMAPLYASRTAVVVAPTAFAQLERGMAVVYRTSDGRLVAHVLTGDLREGWIAQGLANDTEDDELVTSRNLIGVIVAAFADAPSPARLAREARGRADSKIL